MDNIFNHDVVLKCINWLTHKSCTKWTVISANISQTEANVALNDVVDQAHKERKEKNEARKKQRLDSCNKNNKKKQG